MLFRSASAIRGLDWLLPRQVLDVAGDWTNRRPQVRPGGWAFQYANPHYPDLDDTAVVVMAMDRAQSAAGQTSNTCFQVPPSIFTNVATSQNGTRTETNGNWRPAIGCRRFRF